MPDGPNRHISAEQYQRGVGKRLRWVREAAGHTQEQAARLVGVEQSAWSKWEMGSRMADPYRMLTFCARYKVSMGYVYQASLVEVHPDLARLLLEAHPELQPPTKDTAPDMGTLRDAYRAAIQH